MLVHDGEGAWAVVAPVRCSLYVMSIILCIYTNPVFAYNLCIVEQYLKVNVGGTGRDVCIGNFRHRCGSLRCANMCHLRLFQHFELPLANIKGNEVDGE